VVHAALGVRLCFGEDVRVSRGFQGGGALVEPLGQLLDLGGVGELLVIGPPPDDFLA